MRKRKLPISVGLIQIYAYERHEESNISFIDQFPYDNRRDFAIDKNFAGIAVKLGIYNERYDKGVRRNISILLVDMTSRQVVSTTIEKVNIRKDTIGVNICLDFPDEQTTWVAGHTYRLIVTDTISKETLSEIVFHLFDQKKLGHPSKWYVTCDAGIRPAWESTTYKVLDTIDCHDYYVRFNVVPKYAVSDSIILPELELRLYYPDGIRIESQFREPKSYGIENHEAGIKTIEFPFCTCDEANGIFYAELLCMEYPIAGFVFDTERENMTGVWFGREIKPLKEYSYETAQMRLAKYLPVSAFVESEIEEGNLDQLLEDFIASPTEDDNTATDEVIEEQIEQEEINNEEINVKPCVDYAPLMSLDSLTGLKSVKQKLSVYESLVRFNKMRSDKGLPTIETPLHAMFLGSPGTGKTTVAKRMGQMLRRVGILSKGHVVVKERATLLGQNYASESENTVKALEEAQGGILFIDEAYQLYQRNDPRDPGKFVIETLLTALADDSKRDWMLILAGYPDEMKQMFDMNPGFKSRIPDSNVYRFDDFTSGELMEIAENYFANFRYELSDEARTALSERLNTDYSHRDKNFGNARHVMNLIQTEILPAMAVRVINDANVEDGTLSVIQATDIPRYISAQSQTPRKRVGFIA